MAGRFPIRRLAVWLLAVVCAAASVSILGACGRAGEIRDSSGCRQLRAVSDYSNAIKASRPLAERLNRGLRVPGMTLAVTVRGRVAWSLACGYANRARHQPTSEDTRFRIGSVSKAITAAALMRSAADGEVDLDTPISRYLPSFRHGREITLRQLAGHLGGIRHYQTSDEVVNTRHFATVRDSLRIFQDDPLVAPPGTRFAYSSYGYDVIGAALEAATGETFQALVHRTVLAPAHLARTTFGNAPAHAASTFYELMTDGRVRVAPPIDLSDRLPAGGLLSTAVDLVRFGSSLLDGTIVTHAAARTMFTTQKTRNGTATGYGIGFEVHPSPFGLFVGHTGAVDGGTAGLLIHPSTQAVLALATNLGYATAESPPPPAPGTPDPPRILLPFIRH
jgi:serine beta-lactamase-like protein LACTB, mitochondrial